MKKATLRIRAPAMVPPELVRIVVLKLEDEEVGVASGRGKEEKSAGVESMTMMMMMTKMTIRMIMTCKKIINLSWLIPAHSLVLKAAYNF